MGTTSPVHNDDAFGDDAFGDGEGEGEGEDMTLGMEGLGDRNGRCIDGGAISKSAFNSGRAAGMRVSPSCMNSLW